MNVTLLFIIYSVILVTGCVIGCFSFNKYKAYQPIVILLGVTFLLELMGFIIAKIYHYNLWLYHISNPIESSILFYFFYFNIQNRNIKKIIFYSWIALIIFGIINTFFIQTIKLPPTYFILFSAFLSLIFSIILFIQCLDLPSTQNIFTNPIFLSALTVIWFSLTSFAFFIINHHLIQNKIINYLFYIPLYISNYIYYGIYVVASFFALKNTDP
ncbi:MAG: hypothetical protein IPL97_12635 [Niastella sp.]|nr:hypothetical protein [Niastella sp.]